MTSVIKIEILIDRPGRPCIVTEVIPSEVFTPPTVIAEGIDFETARNQTLAKGYVFVKKGGDHGQFHHYEKRIED